MNQNKIVKDLNSSISDLHIVFPIPISNNKKDLYDYHYKAGLKWR